MMTRGRVLVVDDEHDMREMVCDALYEFDVEVAESGQAALELLRSRSFEVVVTDNQMPKMSGIELMRAVKERAPTTAVVMMTAYGSTDTAVAALRLGAFDFVLKPFDVDNLTETVQRAVDRCRQQTAATRLETIGELTAGVAHEINNPLLYVIANHELLRDQTERLRHLWKTLEQSTDPDEIRAAWREAGEGGFLDQLDVLIDDLGDGATRIRDIAADLRTIARRPAGKSSVDLCVVIRSALRLAGKELNRTTVTVDVAPARIAGDAGRLCQVFVNLFVNAAQAMKGRPRSTLAVRGELVGDRVVLRVIDNGPGIAGEILPRIFERYFTTKPGASGTGLGLAISREIVENHGGEIAVASALDAGTTFTVTLPSGESTSPR